MQKIYTHKYRYEEFEAHINEGKNQVTLWPWTSSRPVGFVNNKKISLEEFNSNYELIKDHHERINKQ